MTNGSEAIPLEVQRTVIALLTADTADLRVLARIAGRDPATFYRGANLRRTDLSKADLDGIDFSGGDKAQSTMPHEVAERYWPQFDYEKGNAALQSKKTIDSFTPYISADSSHVLKIVFIRELMIKGDPASIELAVLQFLELVASDEVSYPSDCRLIWANLLFGFSFSPGKKHLPLTLDERLLSHEVLNKLEIEERFCSHVHNYPLSRKELVTLAQSTSYFDIHFAIASLLEELGQSSQLVWAYAIKAAPYFQTALRTVSIIRHFGNEPALETWLALVEKAPDMTRAFQIFDLMNESGIEPDMRVLTSAARLSARMDQVAKLTQMLGSISGNRDAFWVALLHRMVEIADASHLLSWIGGELKDGGLIPPGISIEAAMRRYHRQGRHNEAKRLAVAYPNLKESIKLIGKRKSRVSPRKF